MNNLFATWRHAADIDLDCGLDAAELLSRARRQLVEVPALAGALRLVDAALADVSAWFDQRDEPTTMALDAVPTVTVTI
jgi:hypothetical protein